MVDSIAQSCIDTVIKQKVAAGELFTAFDVSNAAKVMLRKTGDFNPSVHRHSIMRDYVNLSLNDIIGDHTTYDYMKTLCSVSATESAYVYHKQNDDPSSYNSVGVVNPTPVVQQTVPVVAKPAVAGKMPDARGTICVPSSFLENAGFARFDNAYIYKRNNGLLVTKVQSASLSPDALYTVDSYLNVRITKYTLDKCGMNSSLGFVFANVADGVLVEEA